MWKFEFNLLKIFATAMIGALSFLTLTKYVSEEKTPEKKMSNFKAFAIILSGLAGSIIFGGLIVEHYNLEGSKATAIGYISAFLGLAIHKILLLIAKGLEEMLPNVIVEKIKKIIEKWN